tara:strand:+ start:206 stop:1054 length:849 start_codon:yes stop_codon:yes gene_type:complete
MIDFHIKEATNALSLMKDHIRYIVYVVLLDILFLLIYGFVKGAPELTGFLGKTYDYLKVFLTLVSQNAKSITEEVAKKTSVVTLITTNELIRQYFLLLVFTLLLFAVVAYFLYGFIIGSAWYNNTRMLSNKIGYKEYIKQFYLVTIPFFILFIIHSIISFIETFRQITLERMTLPIPSGLSTFLLLYMLVIFYFALIAYSLIGKYPTKKLLKKTLHIGIKKSKTFFPAFIIMVLVFFIANLLMLYLGSINPYTMLVVGIIVLFPVIAWTRLYAKLVVDRIEG